LTEQPPAHLIDWRGEAWSPESGRPASHPNGRFTSPAAQCPVIDPEWENPQGVPISAFLFGGRRPTTVPLVTQAFNWNHGVFLGSIIASETTAAAAGAVGQLRRDPFAMLPFCGYHMGEYFDHWFDMGESIPVDKQPQFFAVNWFRKDSNGTYLWPGYGDNSRVLKWIFERVDGAANAVPTPIGYLPAPGALDTTGLGISPEAMAEVLRVDIAGWQREAESVEEYYKLFADRLPQGLRDELHALQERLQTKE